MRGVDGAVVPPAEFLPAVSDNHLGEQLDQRILEIALRDVAGWARRGLLPVSFSTSVNLCAASSRSASFPDHFGRVVADTGVAASSVVFEISEASLHLDVDVVRRLREFGARVALDDLGVQNSNTDRIVDLAPDIGKIDRRWLGVPGAGVSEHHRSVLRSLVELCRSLDVEIVAEGVETQEQLELLVENGVELIQGYIFARPEPADASLVVDVARREALVPTPAAVP